MLLRSIISSVRVSFSGSVRPLNRAAHALRDQIKRKAARYAGHLFLADERPSGVRGGSGSLGNPECVSGKRDFRGVGPAGHKVWP